VVAERDHVDPGAEQLRRLLRRDADAARRVLPVGDREVDRELLAQVGQQVADDAAARARDDVTDEQDGCDAC
jgi:hypothetical protein